MGAKVAAPIEPLDSASGAEGGAELPDEEAGTPSTQEVQRHNIDHYPYRDWCRACVAATGRSNTHHRGGGEQNAIPVLAAECALLPDGGTRAEANAERSCAPILVLCDETWEPTVSKSQHL